MNVQTYLTAYWFPPKSKEKSYSLPDIKFPNGWAGAVFHSWEPKGAPRPLHVHNATSVLLFMVTFIEYSCWDSGILRSSRIRALTLALGSVCYENDI